MESKCVVFMSSSPLIVEFRKNNSLLGYFDAQHWI